MDIINALFKFISDENKSLASLNGQRKKFYETMPGVIFPEDWDDLPETEKEERLNRVAKAVE